LGGIDDNGLSSKSNRMMRHTRPLLIVIETLIILSSCTSPRLLRGNRLERADTLNYSTYMGPDNLVSGNSIFLGPFLMKLGPLGNNALRQNNTFSIKQESSDVFQFSVCRKNICLRAESQFYEKRKTTLVGGKNGVARVRTEKIYGQIVGGNEAVMNFEVNRKGRLRGYGFFRVSDDEMVRIKPTNKKTSYGKKAYAVGLDFILNDAIIGSFLQARNTFTVAMRKELDENMQLIIVTLSLALINRSDEIIIF